MACRRVCVWCGLHCSCAWVDQLERTLGRVVEALGLAEMGKEVTNDVEMIVCRCHQLVKLEGEKIMDKVGGRCKTFLPSKVTKGFNRFETLKVDRCVK